MTGSVASGSSSSSSGSVLDREASLALSAQSAEEKRQETLIKEIAERRAAHREEWNDSEVADVHAQTAEAERIMRLPTPDAHKALGTSKPNPLKGPSS